jgi:hypothetical protein
MTRLLKKAFDEASQLADTEQDAVAQWLMAELAAERQWDELLQRSPDHLERLARSAIEEHDAGETQELNPDAL